MIVLGYAYSMTTLRQVADTVLVDDFVVRGWYDRTPGDRSRTVLNRVEISIDDGAPEDVFARGINSGTLRRVEAAVKELARRASEREADLLDDYHRRADAALTALAGRSPRAYPNYYSDLLDASNLLRLAGDTRSIHTLSERLGVRHATVATQLRTAKKQREDARRWAEAEGII